MSNAIKKILVVDDRALNQAYLSRLLQHYHHEVLPAAGIEEALAIAQKKHPDLVMTDISTPGMNGFILVQKLRADPELKNIPVIFFTAIHNLTENAVLTNTENVQFVLANPSRPETVMEIIHATLGVSDAIDKAARRKVCVQVIPDDRFMTVGALASAMAHRINNPIAWILSNLNYMRENAATLDKAEMLELINESIQGVERIHDIVLSLKGLASEDGGAISGSDIQSQKRSVLIVDDEPLLLKSYKRMLEGHYNVSTAQGGQAAIDLLEKSPQSYDLILSDLSMPDVSGVDLYRYVAKRYPGREKDFIFMTGDTYTPGLREFLASVNNICMEKPFTLAQLEEALKKWFEKK